MSDDKTTASARIDGDEYAWVKERLDDEGFDSGITSLMRTTFALYREDEDYRNFMESNMLSDPNVGLIEYTSSLLDEYEVEPDATETAAEGLQELISGVQNRNYSQSIRGGRKLGTMSDRLGEHAAEYLAGMPESYWQDI